MDEQRKYAVLLAATIFAARKLQDCEDLRTPRAVAAISDAITKATMLLREVERRIN